MRMVDLIVKQNGRELTTEEIQFFVKGYTDGSIPDYQASALAMAIYFQDMTDQERADLTMAMVNSGKRLISPPLKALRSTSTLRAGSATRQLSYSHRSSRRSAFPLLKCPTRSYTGTIDKLEAIEGFHVELSKDEFIKLVNRDKVAVIGQSGNLTPADKSCMRCVM